jgi:selenocysteine-specific elongation factor
VIVGTAGHIDHGKTALVRALTGVDTDRLPEEKKRGITIELGFAPLTLDGVGLVGVVDVPGHEAFVRTMVAGATGIDLALLVVAADEGAMPQTREHLAILELLGVNTGVIALTKADLVDDEWLALVEDDVRRAAERALPAARIIPTSVRTNRGVDELRAVLASLASSIRSRDEDDLFRMPVDRAFTIKGTGTVVTGTVWSGTVRRDEVVRILPSSIFTRVRGVQGHGARVAAAKPGGRTAIALTGIETSQVPRGSTLVTDVEWRPTMFARADVTLLPSDADAPRPRSWVRFHVGTTEVGARIVSREAKAGTTFSARLAFDAPVVLRSGDRFVLRESAPLNTIGGGVITDPHAPRRGRPWPVGIDRRERLRRLLEESSAHGAGVSAASIPIRLGCSPRDARTLIDELGGDAVVVGDTVISRESRHAHESGILAIVDAFHADRPLESGIPIQLLRSRLKVPPPLAAAAIDALVAAGRMKLDGGIVARPGWSVTLGATDATLAERILDHLDRAGVEPPSTTELESQIGQPLAPVLHFLERRGDIVQVEQLRYYRTNHLSSVLDRIRAVMEHQNDVTPATLRDRVGLSRKYLIPILEYCDRAGLTVRGPSGRVWRDV